MSRLVYLSLGLSALMTSSALSQYMVDYTGGWAGAAYSSSNDQINNIVMQDVLDGQHAADSGSHASGSKAPAHLTGYSASISSARSVGPEFTRRLRAKNPTAAAQVEAQMRQHDFGKVYAGIVAPFGLHRGDAADAITAYTLLGWMIANGRTDPTRPQVAAARRAVAATVSTNPALATEGARARLGEEVAILFVLLHAGWQSAAREGKAAQFSDGVAAMFKQQFGRDLRQMALTDHGFEVRG